MITSRSIDDLLLPVAERARQLVDVCYMNDIQIIITSTYRDLEAQDRLYAQGRSLPGQIVTYAKGGDSWHNWKRAFDIVPIRNGKAVWSIRGHDKDIWMKIGELGMELGLEWGGSWPRHPEYDHFQDRTGKTLYLLKKESGLLD
jgi:peptidoglycan L-alanyl-D-glutamate endopeptidase CwlK